MNAIKYRPDIDGLRALAVGAVVLFHAFPNLLKGGFSGVDVFFVVSGFLISSIIIQDLANGRFTYAGFYTRRIRRIFPALAVVSAAVWLAGWYILLPDEFRQLGKQLAAGAGFVSNVLFWTESGYFDAAAESKPLLHLWSLGIEEQFYIVWPLVLGLLWRGKRGPFVATLAIAAVSFGINAAIVGTNAVAAFYLPFSRFWELMIGGILAHAAVRKFTFLESHSNAQSAAGLLLIGAGVAVLNKESVFPGYGALLPTLGTFLVISAGPNAWLNKYVLGNRLLVAVGLISYPLYLWHWPVLVFLRLVNGQLLTPTGRGLAILAAVVLAFLTYRIVERPLRRAPGKTVPLLLGLAMASIGVFGLMSALGTVQSRLQTANISRLLAASYDWEYPPVASENHGFGPLRYFVEKSKLDTYTVFFGDSNLEQYGPRIDAAIKANPEAMNGAILAGNQSGCLLLTEILNAGGRCREALKKLEELIAQPSTRSVAIAAAWIHYETELARPESQMRFAQFLRSIAATKKVFLIMNIPTGEELSPKDMFTGSRLTKIEPKPVSAVRFDFERFQARYRDTNKILSDVANASGSTLIDPVLTLCPKQACPVFDANGRPLYLDSRHLTRSYAASSALYIDQTLRPSAPESGRRRLGAGAVNF